MNHTHRQILEYNIVVVIGILQVPRVQWNTLREVVIML